MVNLRPFCFELVKGRYILADLASLSSTLTAIVSLAAKAPQASVNISDFAFSYFARKSASFDLA